MKANMFHYMAQYLKEVLPFLRERISALPKSVYWQGVVGRFLRELISLPSFQPLIENVRKDRTLSESFLRYPPILSEHNSPFPTEKADGLFFISYISPLLERYVLDKEIDEYFWGFSEERFARLCRTVEEYISKPDITLLFVAPLIANFKLSATAVELGHTLKIRSFLKAEKENWEHLAIRSKSETVKFALEWYADCDKKQAYDFIADTAMTIASKAVGCLRILGADVWIEGVGYAEWPLIFTTRYPAGVVYVHELMIPQRAAFYAFPEIFDFTETLVEQYRNMWRKIRKLPDNSRLNLALGRLNDCYARFNNSDRLVDAWVGLDALAGQEGQEMGYAISNRLSFLITSAFGGGRREVLVTKKRMKESYRARGAVIHPRPTKRSMSEGEISDMAEQATNWLREGIQAAIKCDYTGDIPQKIDEAIFSRALQSQC